MQTVAQLYPKCTTSKSMISQRSTRNELQYKANQDLIPIFKKICSDILVQGFPTVFLPCTPSAFRQMSMYPYSISTDKDVPLQNFDR